LLSPHATLWQSCGRAPSTAATRYQPQRFPVASLSHAVGLSLRFCVSVPDGEARLGDRGVSVPHAASRTWGRQFGPQSAPQLRRRRPRPGDTGHLAEGGLSSTGARPDLGRAVEQQGNVLALLLPRRRDKRAAQQCSRQLLQGLTDVPGVIRTDKLKSYGAAKRERRPGGNLLSLALCTTGRRTRISPRGSGSGAGRGSSRQGTPRAASPPTAPSRRTSPRAALSPPPAHTAKPSPKDCTLGRPSQAQRWPDKRQWCGAPERNL